MKILFLSNNEIAFPLIDWLRDVAGEDVVVTGQRLTPDFIASIRPDLSVSYNYRFILTPRQIARLDNKVINVHISYLPWNRGVAPNLWSFLDDTPKGVTIHEIDAGLDTGRVLVQKECCFDERSETLASSYQTLHLASHCLFKENWDAIRSQSLTLKPQSDGGSTHSLADFAAVKHLLEPEGWQIPVTTLKQRHVASVLSERS